MTTKVIEIDTSTLETKTPNDVRIYFPNSISLGSLNWDIALFKLNCWNSVFNVEDQTLEYSANSGGAWHTITLPDGIYGVEDFNSVLHAAMETNGHWDSTNKSYYISLYPNYSVGKVYLEITSGTYQLRIPDNDMPILLGFLAGDYTTTQYGSKVPDINLGRDLYQINCDLVDESYTNGVSSQVLFKFTPNVGPYFNIEQVPQPEPIWLPISKASFNSVRVWITDQMGRELDFQGENIQYQIVLRERNV
jgi:hypothetical protein